MKIVILFKFCSFSYNFVCIEFLITLFYILKTDKILQKHSKIHQRYDKIY